MPITPVIYPPVLKLIFDGDRLAKSFAGLTILAAMLVAKVDRATAIMAMLTNNLLSNFRGLSTFQHDGRGKNFTSLFMQH